MNIGLTGGVLAGAAGAPLAQSSGAETERTQKDSSVRERVADGQSKSERASGIGTTDADQQTDERDADGRRLWEQQEQRKKAAADGDAAEPRRAVKDPTGVSGNSLDLTG
jgi:hypothetical protein